MKTVHATQREKVKCTICNHWITKYFIKSHMRKHNEPGKNCKICGKFLKNLSSFTSHMKIVHSDAEKKFICNYCGKGFARQIKLKEHIAAVHTREYLYTCRVPGCNKKFRAEGNWKMHEKRAHPEVYNKIFKPSYKWGPNEQPPQEFEEALKNCDENDLDTGVNCEHCGKFLASAESHWSHVLEFHSEGSQRYKCHLCDKGFYREMKLKEHIAVIHTREFLFKCRIPGCDRGFRSKSNWKLHERRAHPKEYENLLMNSNEQPQEVEEVSENHEVGGDEGNFENYQ